MIWWPFSRRSAPSLDEAISDAVGLAAEEWASFRETSTIPGNIHLRDQIAFFANDFIDRLCRRFPVLLGAPDEVILLIIAQGIEKSGIVPRRKIELQLGIVLPA